MRDRSNAFFAQVNEQPKNGSATQFDRLTAELGFLPNDSLSLNVPPVVQIDGDAYEQYQAIEPLLNRFLAEELAGAASNPIPPLPSEIKDYLVAVQPKLAAVQAHLLQQTPPQWEVNPARMSEENYPFPGLINVFNTQKLLLLLVIWHSEQNQQTEMLSALDASWRLNQAISQRPDLVAKISAFTIADHQATLLRHLDSLPENQLSVWQQRLSQQAMQHSVVDGIRFDTWLQYATLQKSLNKITAEANLTAIFSPVHSLGLANVDTAQAKHRAIDMLSRTSVCDLSQIAMTTQLGTVQTAEWNDTTPPNPELLAKRWRKAGDRALSLELTQHVLNAQQHYHQQGQWPSASRFASTECPGAHWMQQQTEKNTFTIHLDAALTPPPSQPLQASLTAPLLTAPLLTAPLLTDLTDPLPTDLPDD